jgi:hypothetical protein
VRAAAVIGIPDERLGERVAGFIQVVKGAPKPDLRALITHLSVVIADYKLPEMLKIVDDLPRNVIGKIDRAALRSRGSTDWDLDFRCRSILPASPIIARQHPVGDVHDVSDAVAALDVGSSRHSATPPPVWRSRPARAPPARCTACPQVSNAGAVLGAP